MLKDKQIRTVLLLKLVLFLIIFVYSYSVWHLICSDDLEQCFAEKSTTNLFSFFILSILRPLFLTPISVMVTLGAQTWDVNFSIIINVVGSLLSTLLIYFPSKYIGDIHIKPWLMANLPATWNLIRTQDYKFVVATRIIPIFPFDFMSIVYGVADFRVKSVVWGTLLGMIPEILFAVILAKVAPSFVGVIVIYHVVAVLLIFAILLRAEYVTRRKGNSLWRKSRAVWSEFLHEVRHQNSINEDFRYKGHGEPVVLMYGFFATLKSLENMRDMLQMHGYDVLCVKTGGWFGIFNTMGVKEFAGELQKTVEEKRKEYGFDKVQVIAHSKGGLAALWWLLKMDGMARCSRLITMGSPYKGTYLTYLALFTPLGLIWKDVWEMRPGSEFLKELHECEVPKELDITCYYSEKDSVSNGYKAVFVPKSGYVKNRALHQITHFGFLQDPLSVEYLEQDLKK